MWRENPLWTIVHTSKERYMQRLRTKGTLRYHVSSKVKNVKTNNLSDQTGLIQDYGCIDDFQCQDNIEEIFVLGNQDATVIVNIAGTNLSILVDSGLSVNAIDTTLFN